MDAAPNRVRQRMRRSTLGLTCAAGGAAIVVVGALAASTWGRADSLVPDLSALPQAVTAAQGSAAASAGSAAQAASSATAAQAAQQAAAQAQGAVQGALASISSDYGGSVTLAQLAALQPSATPGRRYFVTDLGGGAGPVYATGSCFKRAVPSAAPTVVQASQTVSGAALATSSLIQMTAPSSLLASVTVNITGLCPGDVVTVYMPNGVLTAAGTLGVSLNSASAVTVTGIGSAYSADFLWTGSSALKIRGGPVQ